MTQILIVLLFLAGYAVFTVVRPDMECRRCSGWGMRPRRRRRRSPSCPKCKGTGRQFRLGARLVHKGAAAAIRHLRERRESER